jgi:hypothetical protein
VREAAPQKISREKGLQGCRAFTYNQLVSAKQRLDLPEVIQPKANSRMEVITVAAKKKAKKKGGKKK